MLEAHVNDGRVNYPAIKTDGRLMEYLEQLDRIDPNGLSTNERLALWINAYNAYTIKGILDGYSPSHWSADTTSSSSGPIGLVARPLISMIWNVRF